MLESHAQSRRDRLARAYQSLQGLCCGDAFGERFFIPEKTALSLIDQIALPAPPWIFTDDQVCKSVFILPPLSWSAACLRLRRIAHTS